MMKRGHIMQGIDGEVVIVAAAVLAITNAPADGQCTLWLEGGHKIAVQGDVGDVYNALFNSQD